MELRQLEYFVAIVENGSFTGAAKALYVSQSALSKSVKKLEDELGTALFCQIGQRTTPTDAGSVLYEKGRLLLAEAARTRDLVANEMKGKQGRVRIATSCKRAYSAKVGTLAARFKSAHPQISLEFTEASPEWVKDSLMRRTMDVGIIGEALDHSLPTFDELVLDTGEYRLAVHRDNPLAQRTGVRYADLAGEQWIQFPPTFHLSHMVQDGCEKAGFLPNVTITATQPEFVFALVDQGLGISVQPWPEAEVLMGVGAWSNVVMLPIEDIQSKFSVKLITAKNTYISPAVQEFIQFAASAQF